ncbi:MAG: hypothetical protein HOQ32_19950 [Lysobacter sp.]|nr:hypothetical protein [Lysobacter sp.]
MAQVPKIDTPCPLGIDEQRRIDGHCARCDKQVHKLDAMSDSERRALLAKAEGPLCVSYRAPRPQALRRGAGFGIAIAATLVSGGAFASDPPALLPAAAGEQASPVTPAPLLAAPASAPDCEEDGQTWVLIGGVNDPSDAQWVDDSELPELPIREAAALEDAVVALAPTSVVNPVSTR